MEESVDAEAGLRRLHDDIRARGLDRKPTGRIVAELCVHLLLALGGIALFLIAEHPLAAAFAMLLSTAGSLGVGSNTHTASHGAASERPWVNQALTYFGSPFFFGVSATYWWEKHIAGHHRAANVAGADPDIDFVPLFALNEMELRAARGWRRWYYAHLQWLVFPLALAFNQFNMQKDGWRHVLRRLREPQRRRPMHWMDLAAMSLHLAVFVGLPLWWFPVTDVAAFIAMRWALFGYAMFAVLAPAHWPAAAQLRAVDSAQRGSFAARQLEATLNFRAGRLLGFFCSGLDRQIEHHLFPGISHPHYPALQSMVQTFCTEQGLPYRTLGWPEALRASLAILRRPKPVQCGKIAALKV